MTHSFRPTLTREGLIGLMLVALCLITGFANPAFLSLATVFDTLRNLTVVGILGMAVMVVMLTGGIDVSFPAIAALTSYATIRTFIALGLNGPVIAIFALAVAFGVLLGLVNGLLVARLRLPALIVTLGTSSLYYGFNLFFLGSQYLFNVPKTLLAFSHSSLLQVADARGRTWSLHPVTLIFLAVTLMIAFVLRYTIFGRSLYAIGASRESAERIGLPVRAAETLAFVAAGDPCGDRWDHSGHLLPQRQPGRLFRRRARHYRRGRSRRGLDCRRARLGPGRCRRPDLRGAAHLEFGADRHSRRLAESLHRFRADPRHRTLRLAERPRGTTDASSPFAHEGLSHVRRANPSPGSLRAAARSPPRWGPRRCSPSSCPTGSCRPTTLFRWRSRCRSLAFFRSPCRYRC